MEWTTEKPTEPGFYFATDGSPVLCIYILNREGELYDVAATFQSTWTATEVYESYHMTPMPEMKYWCKIPVPDKPESHLTMLASEDVLRREWDTPEEDEAWADLKTELDSPNWLDDSLAELEARGFKRINDPRPKQ